MLLVLPVLLLLVLHLLQLLLVHLLLVRRVRRQHSLHLCCRFTALAVLWAVHSREMVLVQDGQARCRWHVRQHSCERLILIAGHRHGAKRVSVIVLVAWDLWRGGHWSR